MKNSIVIMLLFVSMSLAVKAQNADLESLISDFSAGLSEVKTEKDTYEQSIETLETAVLQYKLVEIDSKGKSTSNTFVFNIADIDPYTVKSETSRDVIQVNFSIANKQKLVATTEDGENEGYEDEVNFYATDIDNARSLVETLKKAIPIAKDLMEKRLSLAGYDAQIAWLKSNINDVTFSDKTFNQTLSSGEYPGSLTFNQTEKGSRGSEVHSFKFNLSDIDPATVKFDISGDELAIGFETSRGRKVIQHIENGEAKPFDDELSILTETVEKARDLRTVLLLAIPEAKSLVENNMPPFSSGSAAIAAIGKYLSEVKYGDDVIVQSIGGDCSASFLQKETDDKGSEQHTYKLNLMDINKEALSYEVSGSKMFVELKTMNKIKLIQEYENDAFSGYEDEFKMYTPDVEVARRLQHALKSSVEWCEKEYKQPFPADVSGAFEWLKSNVSEVAKEGVTFKQSVESVDGKDLNKVKFTKVEVDEKKAVEEIFEFNLSDLNEQSVEFDIGGDDLEIHVESAYNEKVIKYYEDGEIQNYKDEIIFVFDNIEVARGVKGALRFLITEMKSK